MGGIRRYLAWAVAATAISTGYTAVTAAGSAGAHTPVRHTTIAGRIVDEAGHPLAGVEVSSYTAVGYIGGGHARTAADGRYRMVTIPGPQFLYLDGSHATGGTSDDTGYFGTRDRIVVTHYRRTTANVDVTMHPAGAISGQVTDMTGHALSGVGVSLWTVAAYVYSDYGYGFDPVAGTPVEMTKDGHFLLPGVRPGVYFVCFDASSHAATGGATDRRGYQSSCGKLTAVARAGHVTTTAVQQLSTNTGAVIVGRVTNSAHRPLANVAVDVKGGRAGYFSAWTGSDGVFRVGGLPAHDFRICFETAYRISHTPTGYAPACLSQPLTVDGSSVYRVDRSLKAGGTIVGHVRVGGHPLAGVPMSADWNYTYGDEVETATNDNGRYVLKNLPPRGILVCEDADFSSAAGAGHPTGGVGGDCVQRQVSTGHVRTGVDMTLKPAGGVSGVVRGTDGKPMPNVQVDIEGPSQYGNEGEFYAYTDGRGRYTAVDLPSARYAVCFSNFFFYESCYNNRTLLNATPVRVAANQIVRGIDAVLESKHNSLKVVVEDAVGRRLVGVDVVLFRHCRPANPSCLDQPLAGGKRRVAWSAMTNASGQFGARALRAGTYQVCAYAYYGGRLNGAPATGYQDVCAASTITVTASTNRTVVMHLVDAGAVTGRVTDADGNPLADVRVHVSGAAADDFVDQDYFDVPTPHIDAYTDDNGYYTIRSVPAGSHTVCFDPQYRLDTSTLYQPQCFDADPGTTSGGTPVDVTADASTGPIDIALAVQAAAPTVQAVPDTSCELTYVGMCADAYASPSRMYCSIAASHAGRLPVASKSSSNPRVTATPSRACAAACSLGKPSRSSSACTGSSQLSTMPSSNCVAPGRPCSA